MAIVEALATGVPVIASDCPYGPREILCPESDPSLMLAPDADFEVAPYGVLFPVGSVRALERAMRRVISDAALRSDLAQRGPVRAADFSAERSAIHYDQLLFLS